MNQPCSEQICNQSQSVLIGPETKKSWQKVMSGLNAYTSLLGPMIVGAVILCSPGFIGEAVRAVRAMVAAFAEVVDTDRQVLVSLNTLYVEDFRKPEGKLKTKLKANRKRKRAESAPDNPFYDLPRQYCCCQDRSNGAKTGTGKPQNFVSPDCRNLKREI